MRTTLFACLAVVALAGCSKEPPPPKGEDLTIDVVLAMDNGRCVVRLSDAGQKNADHAIAWTNHRVTWQVVRNDCGDKAKIDKKALGLKSLKVKTTGNASWSAGCTKLDRVPASGTVEFHCQIPSSALGKFEGVYEYEIDGDQVEPGDPEIGVRRDG